MKAAIIALSRADIGDYTYYINQVVDNARQLGALSGCASTQDEFLADVLSACGVPVCEISAHDMSTVSSRDYLGGQTVKLYEIDSAILEVIENDFSFDDETGEVFFTVDDLNALDMARNEKLEGCLLFIKNCESEANAIKAEITALQARMKRKQAAADRLREYVLYSMESMHDKTFETAKAYARVGYYQRVDVEDMGALPHEYVREKVTATPDKTAIKKAIKAGAEVKGARLVSYPSLTVK